MQVATQAPRSWLSRFRTVLAALALMLGAGAAVVAVTASPAAASVMSNGWTQPLASMTNPADGFLADGCGQANNYLTNKFHIGADYWGAGGPAGPGNDPVYALGDGTVTTIGTGSFGSGNGYVVMIHHTATDGSSFTAVYGHLNDAERPPVKNADGTPKTVHAGDQIGTLYPAAPNGPHLHLGIHPDASGAMPTSGWGSSDCPATWPPAVPSGTNGFVDPMQYLSAHPLGGSVGGGNGATTVLSSQLTVGSIQHVFTSDTGQSVIDTSWTGTGQPTPWTVATQLGATVVSLSSQYVDGVVHIYATTNAGAVDDIYWGNETLGQRPVWYSYTAGNVLSSLVTAGSVQHVFTGTASGDVYDTYWTGTGAPSTQHVGFTLGHPVVSISSQYVDGVVHVYAATSAGAIDDIYWGNGTALGQRPIWNNGVSGDVIGSLVTAGSVQHVFVGDTANNIRDFSWTGTGTVSGQQIGFTLGAAITSISSQYVSGVVHVYAVTNAGSTDDIYWGGGTALGQRQAWANPNQTSGEVLSAQLTSDGVQHVYTGTPTESVYETTWIGTGPTSTRQVR